jgi:hypothetical protein
VAKRPPPDSADSETPKEFPGVTPRDLYPTSDIRFVMIEIGKLTANVATLISDVKSQGTKIDNLSHQVSFVKGGVYVVGGIIALIWAISINWGAITHFFTSIPAK